MLNGSKSTSGTGVHPQYRKKGIAKAFCEKALRELVCSEAITVTTFREGDKAATGHRKTIKSLGFAEAELLVEFGYPTQRQLSLESGGLCFLCIFHLIIKIQRIT